MSYFNQKISKKNKEKLLKMNGEEALQKLLEGKTFNNFKESLLMSTHSSVEDDETTKISLIVYLIQQLNNKSISWFIVSDDDEHYETFSSIFKDIRWSQYAWDFRGGWGEADAEIDELGIKLSSVDFEKNWKEYLKINA